MCAVLNRGAVYFPGQQEYSIHHPAVFKKYLPSSVNGLPHAAFKFSVVL
jgi:hypothetical protein